MPNDKQQTSFAFLQKPIFALILIPGLFIFLWSNGYIGAKLVLPHSSPWTILSLRFAIVAVIMTGLAFILKSPWPTTREQIFHTAIVGILLQALYLGGAFMGMDSGIDAATSALIGALPPLFTAIAAYILIRERLSLMGWLGMAIGMFGVFIVVTERLDLGFGSFNGFIANFLGAIALAIAAAYQKRYMASFNWVTASVIQFTAAAIFCLICAAMFEDMKIEWTARLFTGLALLVFALSIGAVTLLQLLIKRGAATGVMSLLFLVPVSTALIAWPLFGETFSFFSLFGFALAVLGVRLVQKGVIK